jgi:hypothetical protein
MKTLAFLLAIGISGIALADDKSVEAVKVYCFSADLEEGFKDDHASYFCKELGKRGKKKKSFVLVNGKDSAHALVQYLGTEEITAIGETTYLVGSYAWTPQQTKSGAKAVVGIGEYTKGFQGTGLNDVALMNCWEKVENWIRANRDTILEKAKKK